MIQMGADAFDAAGTEAVLDVSFPRLELRQADGLLTADRRVLHAEVLGPLAREAAGLPERAPALRLYVQPLPQEE